MVFQINILFDNAIIFRMFFQKIHLFFLLINLTLIRSQDFPTFDQYMQQQQKVYGPDEYQKRLHAYQKNIKAMQAITQYIPAVNKFTDETDQQRAARKNMKIVEQDNRTARVPPKLNKVGTPSSFDWRENGVITSIKDQGSCGACWAFVTAAHAESLLIMQGRFNQSIDLSEKYLIGCTRQSDCGGGYLQYALMAGKSLPLQITYPYISTKKVNCSTRKITIASDTNDYYNLTDSDLIALLLQAPLPISISSDSWQTYGSGVFKCKPDAKTDHAVLLVGYTPDYWIIKNQWGTKYGMNGYIHVSRNRTVNCKIGGSAHMLKQLSDDSDDQYFKKLMSDPNNQNPDNITNTYSPTINTINQTKNSTSKFQNFIGCYILNIVIALIVIQFNL